MGFPIDSNSSFLRGPALAPSRIRQVLHSGSDNSSSEDGTNLEGRWRDLGDVTLGQGETAAEQITKAVNDVLESGAKLLALGGDHSITYPIIRAFAEHHPDLTLLHSDAHSDLCADFQGNPYSHASPFARITEAGLVRRLVQVGIRTLNPHQREQAHQYGVEIIEARSWRGVLPRLMGPVYVSLDLDVIEPGLAPGVSHHEPGRLSVREVLNALWQIETRVVGADIVELNPVRDVHDITAAVAATCCKALLTLLSR